MESPGYDSSIKRRKVRKGTRSCWACKHRKVRCIFATPNDAVCISCRRRKTECVGQEYLEEVEPQQKYTSPRDRYIAGDPAPVQGRRAQHGGNRSCGELLTPDSATHEFQGAPNHGSILTKTTKGLIEKLPPQADLEIVLQKLSSVCLAFYAFKAQSTTSRRKGPSITSAGLRSQSAHPVLLARHMLLLAIGMQHCCFKAAIPSLTEHPRQMADRLARSAIDLVTTNDALLTSVESVDNIILEACFLTNKGDMHRSWMALRRAIMAAQLMGLHQSDSAICGALDDQQELDRSVIWSCTQGMERLVSLLVGLPTSVPITEGPHGLTLAVVAKSMAARIIQRNDIIDPLRSDEQTLQIETDLLKISEELSKLNGVGKDGDDATPDVQQLFHELCFQTMVLQLHAPYMLFAADESRRVYSTVACVQAAHVLLIRQRELCKLGLIHPCCGMSDFMACVAGIILMLAHIMGHSMSRMSNVVGLQRSGDRKILELALGTIKALTEKDEESFVTRCIESLELLLNLDAQAASGQTVDVQRSPAATASSSVLGSRVVIGILGAGEITVTRGGLAADPSQGPPLILGGVGSLQTSLTPPVNTHATAAQSEQEARAQDPFTAPSSVAADPMGAAPRQPWTQQDSLDHEWLFDGVLDTSVFFDAFARGEDEFSATTF